MIIEKMLASSFSLIKEKVAGGRMRLQPVKLLKRDYPLKDFDDGVIFHG